VNKQPSIDHLLKKHSLSKTPCRRSILELFINSGFALSHHDVEKGLKSEYDRVTIYRTFNSFEEKGLIHKVVDHEGVSKYALCHHDCSTGHHNDSHLHFSCNKCNKTVCIDNIIIPEIKVPAGFQLNKLNLVGEGVCKNCSL
jgi:Fur family transcriptional regulator, ferric uptake regulator